MALLRNIASGLQSLFRKEQVSQELDEELNGFLKSSMVLIAGGSAAGIAATRPLMRLVARLLFGVHPLGTVTGLATPVILVAIGAAATYLPARRATKVDPMVALRYK